MIYHFITTTDLARFVTDNQLRPESLETEGFIHCSLREQFLERVNYLAPYSEEMELLEIDESRLGAEVRMEASSGSEVEYPHVYGPIPMAAVVAQYHLEWDGEDGYACPQELL